MKCFSLALLLLFLAPARAQAARSFNGSSAYIDFGSSALLPATSAFTVAMRVRVGTIVADDILLAQYLAASGNGRFLLRVTAGTPPTFNCFLGDQGSHSSQTISVGSVPQSTWALVALSRSGATFAGYVDATKTTHTDADATRVLQQTGVILGARTGGTTYNASLDLFYAGEMAELAIWSVTLTDDEIASLAAGASPLQVRPSGLIYHAPLVRELIEQRTGRAMTNSGTTVSDHPRTYR